MAAVEAKGAVTPAQRRASGFTDWLPGQARRRRDLAGTIIATFESWGYGLLDTPLVELLETVAAGIDSDQQAELFRFADSDGAMLALVAERTVSVARVVASHLAGGPYPLRLCYSGPVLRNAALLGGRRREAMQAGCELVGSDSLSADAECIALAACALRESGVHSVQIDVGHADFIPGLLESAGLDSAVQASVLASLARRDLVAVEEALERTDFAGAERRLVLAFPTLRGGPGILEAAAEDVRGERPRRALEQLGLLWDLLVAHGIDDSVQLDLGAVRDWDYYTGPIFEVFARDSGFPLGSGGRYDRLLQRFGLPEPATGFVLHIDRCYDTVSRRGGDAAAASALRIAWNSHAHADALRLASTLRALGVACHCNLTAGDDVTADARVDAGVVRYRKSDEAREASLEEAAADIAGTLG